MFVKSIKIKIYKHCKWFLHVKLWLVDYWQSEFYSDPWTSYSDSWKIFQDWDASSFCKWLSTRRRHRYNKTSRRSSDTFSHLSGKFRGIQQYKLSTGISTYERVGPTSSCQRNESYRANDAPHWIFRRYSSCTTVGTDYKPAAISAVFLSNKCIVLFSE